MKVGHKGYSSNKNLFWTVFSLIILGLILLMVTGTLQYRPQPLAAGNCSNIQDEQSCKKSYNCKLSPTEGSCSVIGEVGKSIKCSTNEDRLPEGRKEERCNLLQGNHPSCSWNGTTCKGKYRIHKGFKRYCLSFSSDGSGKFKGKRNCEYYGACKWTSKCIDREPENPKAKFCKGEGVYFDKGEGKCKCKKLLENG